MIMPQESLIVEPVQVLGDNYVWMFPSGQNSFVAVDPGSHVEVVEWLDSRNATLSHILLTHHHGDHTGGVAALRRQYRPQVIGSRRDVHRLPTMDQEVDDGEVVELGIQKAKVFLTPGHTTGHVIYQVEDALFTGDTLFAMGCGRLFEGTAAMMHESLAKIGAMDDATRIFPAHEYTLTNHGFALSLEPDSADLLAIQEDLRRKNDSSQPTLPTTLGDEKKLNPFLRVTDDSLAQRLGLENKTPVERFAAIREMRNHY